MSFASGVTGLSGCALIMLETHIVMSSLIFYLVLTLVLHLTLLHMLFLSSLIDLTIAHMVLVHERTTLSLDALVTTHAWFSRRRVSHPFGAETLGRSMFSLSWFSSHSFKW
jgi:hypothetical protein